MSEVLKVANSTALWVFGAILILFVLLQNTLFLKLAKKEAKTIDFPKDKLKESFKTGFVTAIGPALSNIVAMVSMMAGLGSPVAWMRLSVIGNATTELGISTIVSLTQGLKSYVDPNMNLKVFALILIMMATVCTGWLLVVIIATPSMGAIRTKIIDKDKVWAGVLSTATMVGLFSNLAALQLKTADKAMFGAVGGAFITMFLIYKVFAKKNKNIKKYALTIALFAGVVVGGIVAVL